MRLNRYCSGTPGGRVLAALAVALLIASAPATQAQVADATRVIVRGSLVSPLVPPADTSALPAARFPEATALGALAAPLEAGPLLSPSDDVPVPAAAATGDPSVQRAMGPDAMPAPLQSFEGMAGTALYPPDTDGQVGPRHYVQIVNDVEFGARVRVFTRTGRVLHDFGLGQLWPADDPCGVLGFGDPVVLYDQLADRWLLSQFAFVLDRDTRAISGPFYECIAVSRTGTPTNVPSDWFVYGFLVHETKLHDYPKLGVWPDGYYMSANQFLTTLSFAGAGVFAFDRTAMLAGLPAAFQYFDLQAVDPALFGLLPSNLMGPTPPPSGAPNTFVALPRSSAPTQDTLRLFAFHVDWSTPANSTFAETTPLVTAPFDRNLCDAPRERCIDQPEGAPRLEAISDRLMMHLWYRNAGTHGTLVVNHTVDIGDGIAGIRWYEIRGGFGGSTSFADATVHQLGTYGPADGTHRWMGSIAMDRFGNMALGYTASNATDVYPSVRYAGRRAADPPGTLPLTEVTLVAGSGVQLGPASRWGDYSAMSVDPVDDCTFWYTQEYYQTTDEVNWQTRIGSFRFDDCAPTAAAPALDRYGVALAALALAAIARARLRRTGGRASRRAGSTDGTRGSAGASPARVGHTGIADDGGRHRPGADGAAPSRALSPGRARPARRGRGTGRAGASAAFAPPPGAGAASDGRGR